MEDAIREPGKLVDIFQLKDEYGMEQSLLKVGSAINELGMASTANEAYLVSLAKRTAGTTPAPSMETPTGLDTGEGMGYTGKSDPEKLWLPWPRYGRLG